MNVSVFILSLIVCWDGGDGVQLFLADSFPAILTFVLTPKAGSDVVCSDGQSRNRENDKGDDTYEEIWDVTVSTKVFAYSSLQLAERGTYNLRGAWKYSTSFLV